MDLMEEKLEGSETRIEASMEKKWMEITITREAFNRNKEGFGLEEEQVSFTRRENLSSSFHVSRCSWQKSWCK